MAHTRWGDMTSAAVSQVQPHVDGGSRDDDEDGAIAVVEPLGGHCFASRRKDSVYCRL